MKQFILGFCAMAMLVALSGCAHLTIDNGSLANHVQANPIKGEGYHFKKSFEIEKWNHYFVFLLVPEEHELQELIGGELEPGDIVTDLKSKRKFHLSMV